MITRQQIEKTTAEWESENPVLAADVIGIEVMTSGFNRFKRGNGTTAWKSLPYLDKLPPFVSFDETDGTLIIPSATEIDGALTVNGDSTVDGTLTVNKDLTVGGALTADSLKAGKSVLGALTADSLTVPSIKLDNMNLATLLSWKESILGGGTDIPANADLNSIAYLIPGTYSCPSSANADTIINAPPGCDEGFKMTCYAPLDAETSSKLGNSGTWLYRVQEILNLSGKKWRRGCSTDGNGTWRYGEWNSGSNSPTTSFVTGTTAAHSAGAWYTESFSIAAPLDGLYLVVGSVRYAGSGTSGFVLTRFALNSTGQTVTQCSGISATSGFESANNLVDVMSLTEGNVITVQSYANVATAASGATSVIRLIRIGDYGF